MGNTCSSVKKSSNESTTSSASKDPKTGERKESAESIPYGQVSSNAPTGSKSCSSLMSPNPVGSSISGGGSGVESQSTITARNVTANVSTAVESFNTTTTIISESTTSTSQSHHHQSYHKTQLGVSMSSSPPPPPSLSPIPTAASTPSPYSTPYSTNGGGGGSGSVSGNPSSSSYQNISPTKGHLNLSQFPESVRANSFSQLFHLRPDLLKTDESNDCPSSAAATEEGHCEDYYIIAASTESDELVVWNVFERKAIRVLRGIPRPRDVRMVDQYHAVVLCNRELMLYDLNQASLVTKLKGVMNQKMPYYGLHEDNYVVALSRNRMYVNMINLKTGDLETTFKAGEDRFLNSLLTSSNGKICVCGDETQKPFPLLVWDLSNRKLLYDLRIPHHEFQTRLSAISDDGHYVVSVCQETTTSTSSSSTTANQSNTSPNFLIVYDLQSGTLFKKWKPECDSVSVAISTHSGGCVINGTVNNNVLVWDLSTGNIRYTLSGHTAPANLLQPAEKANIFLSYNSTRADPELRVWSLDNGTCLWRFKPEKDLSCCSLMPNGETIVYGYVGEKELHFKIRKENQQTETEVEEEDDNSEDKVDNNIIKEICSKIVPYGNEELIGQIIDLNNKTTTCQQSK